MKFCINYKPKGQYNTIADEINIDVRNERVSTASIDEICERHRNQRVNFLISHYETPDFAELAKLFKSAIHKNYSIRIFCPTISSAIEEYVQIFEAFELPYYFSMGVSNWETLDYLMKQPHLTDIFVVESLAFDLEHIKECKARRESNIQIRVFPNVAQAEWPMPAHMKFFIPPKLVPEYEKFVDVMDLSFDKYTLESNEEPTVYTDTLYRAYSTHKWSGDLREIIQGLDEHIDERALTPVYAIARRNCARRCFRGIQCGMCKSCIQYAEILYKNYVEQPDKEIREYLKTGRLPDERRGYTRIE